MKKIRITFIIIILVFLAADLMKLLPYRTSQILLHLILGITASINAVHFYKQGSDRWLIACAVLVLYCFVRIVNILMGPAW